MAWEGKHILLFLKRKIYHFAYI